MAEIPETLSGNLLTGAKMIAAYLGPPWTVRKVYHAAEAGNLPIRRVGKTLVSTRENLSDAVSGRSDGTAA